MNRTLKNCKLKSKYEIETQDGKCDGVRQNGDEPIETCRECKMNVYYEEKQDEQAKTD